ncbi:hypothetical protein [Streptomyces sp. ME18-1-4]|uniref:hypothetical protein n=1 Tax=Streptomyces sp. ME18-1-4 TaxID=3028685 RepID=UPI0029BF9A8D|nr:hypothetical protein [Streptomyces sp. ME18-1-4]MDX3241090.1 hypothetical protein [Streptomyces sp. ME18-1-4]
MQGPVPGPRDANGVLGAVTALMAAPLTGLGAAGTAQAATVDTSAWYVLVNRGSGKALDASGTTTAGPCGWGLVQFTFDDWSQAASAPQTYHGEPALRLP